MPRQKEVAKGKEQMLCVGRWRSSNAQNLQGEVQGTPNSLSAFQGPCVPPRVSPPAESVGTQVCRGWPPGVPNPHPSRVGCQDPPAGFPQTGPPPPRPMCAGKVRGEQGLSYPGKPEKMPEPPSGQHQAPAWDGQDSLVLVLEEILLLQTLVHPARGKESRREAVLPDQLQRLGRQQSGDSAAWPARPPAQPRGRPQAQQLFSPLQGKKGRGRAGVCSGTCTCLSLALRLLALPHSEQVERIFSYWINLLT